MGDRLKAYPTRIDTPPRYPNESKKTGSSTSSDHVSTSSSGGDSYSGSTGSSTSSSSGSDSTSSSTGSSSSASSTSTGNLKTRPTVNTRQVRTGDQNITVVTRVPSLDNAPEQDGGSTHGISKGAARSATSERDDTDVHLDLSTAQSPAKTRREPVYTTRLLDLENLPSLLLLATLGGVTGMLTAQVSHYGDAVVMAERLGYGLAAGLGAWCVSRGTVAALRSAWPAPQET